MRLIQYYPAKVIAWWHWDRFGFASHDIHYC